MNNFKKETIIQIDTKPSTMDESDTASTNITNYPEDLQSNENSKDQANFLMKTIQTK